MGEGSDEVRKSKSRGNKTGKKGNKFVKKLRQRKGKKKRKNKI